MLFAQAQQKWIKGYIKDALNDERIPFASIHFVKSGFGKLSDSAGNFTFRLDQWPQDTMVASYVGYQDFKLSLPDHQRSRVTNDTMTIVIQMERGKFASEVIVQKKIDRGLLLWKRIVRRKQFNDKTRFDNFSYELYNKLEVDLNKFNFDNLKENKLLRPFKSLIETHIDTTEETPFLPVYMTETISDYYYQKKPVLRREIIKANNTVGINNESVTRLLGGTDQNVHIYHDIIPVFDKQFISPISSNGDFYYRYKVVDTQYVNGQRLIHMAFHPKRKGENTFEGDCWVHDSTFAIQKINLFISKEANINFVNKLSLIQEFARLPDGNWFLVKDKFVVDLSPMGKNQGGAIGRKTTTFRNILCNDSDVLIELAKNKRIEEIIVQPDANIKVAGYWETARHEPLTITERSVYKMMDTIQQMPAFKRYSNGMYFLAIGYKNIGKLEIGPWFNWISYNNIEGLRIRFDLGTNTSFSKKIFLHSYLAYGFKDENFKYQFDALYLINKNPRSHFLITYKKDIDYTQNYYNGFSQDNMLALAARKPGVPVKLIMTDEKRGEYLLSFKNGLSAKVSGLHKQYNPLSNLPPNTFFQNNNEAGIVAAAEMSLELRYAYLERFLQTTFNQYSLGSASPIFQGRVSKGMPGILGSRFNYTKVSAAISHNKKVAPYGTIYYNIFAGQTFGKLPYMLLDIAPGNEVYYYNKYAFNLVNRYEFLHDKYAGIIFEHNIGNGVFRFIPLVKKLKLRQLYTIKALTGSLSNENYQYNMPAGSPYIFQSLNGRTYLEVGTGIDNIFKVFRVDFLWRLQPQPLPVETLKRFGIFGSFRIVL